MSYQDADVLAGQARIKKEWAKESLKSRYPATYLAIKGVTEIMLPSHKELQLRDDRLMEAFTFARTERALGTGGRKHNHVGTVGNVLEINPSLTTYDDVFQISLKQADKSNFTIQEMFENELLNVFKNFMVGLESTAIDFVFANRSQINVANSQQGIFDVTDNVYQIPEASVGQNYTTAQVISTVMEENNLVGNYLVFCDSLAYDKFHMQMNQGNSNSTNLSFDHGNKTYIRSIGLDDATRFGSLVGTYNKGVWCAVPVGDIATLDWIPIQNRRGVDSKIQTYSNIINPLSNDMLALHSYPVAADGTLTGGYTQDEITEWELSLDQTYMVAPTSVATETPIQAMAIV